MDIGPRYNHISKGDNKSLSEFQKTFMSVAKAKATGYDHVPKGREWIYDSGLINN